ncbi:MAG: hypothetical protein KBS59_01565, partial [Clostridiales bacterium]|nr:hypothetical protein [Clostridiales bacterium]
ITDERDAAEGAYKSASDNLDSINNDLLASLERAGFEISENTSASVEKALEICREKKNGYDDIIRRQNECKSRLAEIEQTISSYDYDFVKQACVREYDDDAMEAYDYHARKRDYEFLCSSMKSQTEKLHQIETRLAALTATNVRPADVAQAKDELEREYADLGEKYEAYRLAIDAMAAASGKLREGLAPKIAKNASAIISTLSNGKYTSLGVDSEFGMTFTSDTVSHDVDLLSAGTSDIAYISLRIALIDVLFRKSIPPFIFDESFMRMDNDRMKNSLTLLCEFGKGGTQSLLFTCHGREEKLMKIIGEYTYYTI